MSKSLIFLSHLLKSLFSTPGTYYILGVYWLLLSYIFSLLVTQLNQAHITPVIWWAGFASIFLVPALSLNTYQKGEGDGFFALIRTMGMKHAHFTFCYFTKLMILILVLNSVLFLQLLFLLLYSVPDLGLHGTALAGLFLLQASFISFSLFLSSLSRDRILCLVLSIALLLGLWLLSYADQLFSGSLSFLGVLLKTCSPYFLFTHFLSGAFYPSEILILAVWIFYPLYLCSLQGER